MKQIISKYTTLCGFGATRAWHPVGGVLSNGWVTGSTIERGKTVWSVAGTLRNLNIKLPDVQASSMTFTIYKGTGAGALTATTLVTTVTAGASTGISSVDLAVLPGDTITIQYDGPNIGSPGFGVGYSIEFESTNTGESGYTIPTEVGTLTVHTNNGFLGGAFGNGTFMDHPGAGVDSNSYSLNCITGSMTRLDLICYAAPGAASWVANVVKNGVVQDGTAGTINTTITMTGATQTGSSTFVLPLVPTDHVDIQVYDRIADIGFATAHFSCATRFKATTDGQFQICGGSNNAVSASVNTYQWVLNEQNITVEARSQVPVGPTGYSATGVYVEKTGGAPNTIRADATYTYTFRVNGADSAIAAVMSSTTSASSLTSVAVADGDLMDLLFAPFDTPSAGQHHWGLALSSLASLTISKVTVPDPDPLDASFTFTISPDIAGGPFLLKNGESRSFASISPADYTIVEQVPTSAWTQVAVIDGTVPAPFVSPLTVVAGVEYALIFTNTYTPPTPPTEIVVDRRVRRATHLSNEQMWTFFSYFQVDLQTGVGRTSGRGSDPMIEIRWSDDFGNTWSRIHKVSIGKIGAYRQRAIIRRLGRARDRIFEVSYSEATRFVLLDAFLGLQAGTS